MTRVAVVIPAFGDPDALRQVLAAVSRQDHIDVEVIVAIDGPDSRLAQVAVEGGAAVVELATNQGSYAARNAGIALIGPRVEVVAFTDVDCVPSTGWLSAHCETLRRADLSGGAIEVTLRERPSPAEYVDQLRHLRQESYVHEEGYAATANLAVRREVLDALSFDPSLRSGGDNDFGRRARLAGFSIEYSPEALVHHPARQSKAEVVAKVSRIIGGMQANPGRWMIRPVPRPRLRSRFGGAAIARTGIRSPLWLIRAWSLQYTSDLRIHKAVTRIRAEQFAAVAQAAAPRIGYFLESYPKVSETFISNEIEELQRTGCEVAIVAVRQGDGTTALAPTHFLQISSGRLRSILLALRLTATQPRCAATMWRRSREIRSETGQDAQRFPRWALWEAADVMRRAKVQLIHSHFAWGGSAAAYCVSGALKLPWSMTVHANDITASRRNLELKLAKADELVTVCRYNVDYLRSEFGLTRDIHQVICGVRVPEPAEFEPLVDIIAVARLVPKKGLEGLVEAVVEVRKAFGDVRVEIIGEGKQRVELQRQIEELGLERHILLMGAMPHDKVLDRIATSRLLCLPARIAANGDRDSMPVVIKEAMAAGIPVVATKIVAIPEMVDASVGRLVEPDDVDGLGAALREVLAMSPEQRKILGETGRRRVQESMTLEGEVAKLRAIFDRLLSP